MDDSRHFCSGSNPVLATVSIDHCCVFAEKTKKESVSNCSEM